MRNKIMCAAQKLSQLDPSMVEAVVTPDAFSIGRQYAMEHRAQILEVDETSLNSSVIGTHGLYAQSLRLKSGQLFTKCTCPLAEQPFCRHCVSALLAHYYRTNKPEIVPPATDPKPPPKTVVVEPAGQPAGFASSRNFHPPEPGADSLNLGLREVAEFVEWMQPAVSAMEEMDTLPSVPERASNQVRRWIEAVQSLDEQRRKGEDRTLAQADEIKTLQVQVGRLTEELDAATRATKEATAAGDDLRRELDQTKGTVQRLSELEGEQRALETRLQSMLGEMHTKGSEVERLSSMLKDVSEALKRAGS